MLGISRGFSRGEPRALYARDCIDFTERKRVVRATIAERRGNAAQRVGTPDAFAYRTKSSFIKILSFTFYGGQANGRAGERAGGKTRLDGHLRGTRHARIWKFNYLSGLTR